MCIMNYSSGKYVTLRHVLISWAKRSASFGSVLTIPAGYVDVIAHTKVWLGTGVLYGWAPVRVLDQTEMGKWINLLRRAPKK